MDIGKIKKDLTWVLAVLRSSAVRVDQHELHTRLAACAEKLDETIKELNADEADNKQE